MLFVYPAIFHKEEGLYWVEFPDLEGCQSFGETLSGTISYAQEALAGYILTILEDNKELPTPSQLEEINCDSDCFSSLVYCNVGDFKETKSVKKTLTIPTWLNERAMAKGINFSQTLQNALMEQLEIGTNN